MKCFRWFFFETLKTPQFFSSEISWPLVSRRRRKRRRRRRMASSKRARPMRGFWPTKWVPPGVSKGVYNPIWHTRGGWAGGLGQGHNYAHLLHLLLPHLIIPCIIRSHCRKCFSYYAMPKEGLCWGISCPQLILAGVLAQFFSLVCASLVQFFSVCSHSPEHYGTFGEFFAQKLFEINLKFRYQIVGNQKKWGQLTYISFKCWNNKPAFIFL